MCKDVYGFLRVYNNFSGYDLIFIDLDGFVWNSKDLKGLVRICKGLYY